MGQGFGQARVSPVQSVALTEAGLWPYRGESCRGEWGEGADGRRRQHWALLSAQAAAFPSSIWPRH